MGYETRLYIVEKGTINHDNGKFYSQVIAMFNMCKFYSLSDVLRNKPKTDCYFYADDGNTEVIEDMYGDVLTEATIESVIDVLENEIANGEDYRRIFPLLSTLKTFKEQKDNGRWGDNLVVLHYGY